LPAGRPASPTIRLIQTWHGCSNGLRRTSDCGCSLRNYSGGFDQASPPRVRPALIRGGETLPNLRKPLSGSLRHASAVSSHAFLVLCTTIVQIARGLRRNFPAVIFNIPDFPSFGVCFGFRISDFGFPALPGCELCG
jgi:hypothetical protein